MSRVGYAPTPTDPQSIMPLLHQRDQNGAVYVI